MIDVARCEVISFEALGTLVDWERGLAAGLERETGAANSGQIERLLRARLECEWELVDEATEFRPFREVLVESMVLAASRCGATLDAEGARRVARGAGEWPLFSDVAPALSRLARSRRLALVTNLDRDDIAPIARRLGVEIARIVTAGDLQVYKPAPELLLALEHELELDEGQLLHVSALPEHDLYTAEDLGVPAVFVNRRGDPLPEDLDVALQVPDLEALARQLAPAGATTSRRGGAGGARKKASRPVSAGLRGLSTPPTDRGGRGRTRG